MGGDKRELRRHTWDLTRGRSPYLRLVILEKLDEVPDKLFADELRADDLRELKTNRSLKIASSARTENGHTSLKWLAAMYRTLQLLSVIVCRICFNSCSFTSAGDSCCPIAMRSSTVSRRTESWSSPWSFL